MKLFYFLPSNNSRRAHSVALHLNAPVDYVFVDLQAGDHRQPDFLALNPAGRIPVLQDGDFVLWESNAIAQYIASQQPTALWPDDPKLRSLITGWQCWEMAHLSKGTQPLQFERFVKQVLGLGDPDPTVIEQANTLFHKEASLLDNHLAQHEYLVNETLTIADFCVASDFTYAIPCQFPMDEYQHIQRWLSAIETLPAWQKSAPQPPAA